MEKALTREQLALHVDEQILNSEVYEIKDGIMRQECRQPLLL